MSKQVWSMNETMGKRRQTVQSHQPPWMAHWMRRSTNARNLDGDVGSCRVSSKASGNEGMLTSQTIHGQDRDGILARSSIIDHNLEGGMQLSSSGVVAANDEGTSKKPIDRMRTHFSAKERGSSSSMPSQDRFLGPSTNIVPYHDREGYRIDKGKAVACSSISRPSIVSSNRLSDTKLKITGEEHNQKHMSSADLIWERKMRSLSKPDISIDDDHHPKSGQDWFQMMEKSSRLTSLLPSRCIAPEMNEQKVSVAGYEQNYPFQKFPSCVRETMKICTTVDSVEAAPGGSPWFSQTTHSLLITKKTDVNVSKETNIFRKFISQTEGNPSGGLENIPSFFGQASRGVKLQPISSYDSEWKRNVGIGASKVAPKNESSAETDIMNLDFLTEERPNSGANSTHSTKVFNFENNLSPRVDIASRNVGRSGTSSRIPDINLELPPLTAAFASSSEDVPSSSRTQSLEMDMLLSHAQPKNTLSPPKPDPTARWVKRLKTSSNSSGQGTKTLNLSENSSRDKKGAIFRSIFKKGSVPTEKETTPSDASGNSLKEDKHLSPGLPKKSKEVLLSQVWIKRWLSNGSQNSQKKDESMVVCEPQNLKSSSLNALQKKQLPSIAAIALMGKVYDQFPVMRGPKAGLFHCLELKGFLKVRQTTYQSRSSRPPLAILGGSSTSCMRVARLREEGNA